MRKLLLASAMALGGTVAMLGVTSAQAAEPAPGTITVRLNGRVAVYAGATFEGDFNTPEGKVDQDFGVASYMRIYPAFDGVAANGLKYGAKIELRQDNGAGSPVNASPSSQSFSRGAVYVRRAYGYIGTDQLGTLRFGQTDGPNSLLLVGTFENFNDGGWNGDAPGMFVGNAALTWPFADVGNNYSSEKIVYLSPQFYGFDAGVSYEPTSTGNAVSPGCNVGGAGCMLLSSTNVQGSLGTQRRRNTIEAGVRYRGSFGAFGLAADANYIGSGKVNDSSTPAALVQYDGLSVGQFGATVTFGGFTVGGSLQFGQMNGSWALLQKGQPQALAWLVGATYGQGPWIIGASYLNYQSAGATNINAAGQSLTGTRVEQGVAVGGTYTLAPGLALYLDYLWDQRKEGNWDFVDRGGEVGPNHNVVQAQYIGTGAMLTW